MIAALVLAGVVAALGGGLIALRDARGMLLQAAGGGAIGIGGAIAALGGDTVGASFSNGLTPRLGIDPLSGVFLAALGLVAAPACLYASASLERSARGRTIGALTGLFVAVLAWLPCARDAVSFLAGWELMSLVPAAIILVARPEDAARRTVFTYVAITHLGGAGAWVCLLALLHANAIGHPAVLAAQGTGFATLVVVAALVGFGTKAGVMPLHAWLPRAHPIAPAHVSALMSGVMIKLALYGLIRVLVDWYAPTGPILGIVLIALGGASALGGIVYAVFAGDLKRLLALSSIENVGIILLAIGASVLLEADGDPTFAAIALAAALLHVVNHAAFKALLFLGAGSLDRAVGGLHLDRLGGLLTRMPRTGLAFAVGAAAVAGLPPLNGFASEWLTLQGLVHATAAGNVVRAIAPALGLATLAATVALAAFCFVKATGLVLLGPPRRPACAEAVEVPAAMWVATAALAGGCVLLGALPGLIVPALVRIGGSDLPASSGLSLPVATRLPTLGVAIGLVLAVSVLVRLRGSAVAAPAPTWACGQPIVPALDWTSAGFTKSLRLVLESVLRPKREITVTRAAGVTRRVSYEGRVPNHLDEQVYRPVVRASLAAAHQARRIQSGGLGAYVAYLTVLVVILLALVRIGGLA